jgi:hypothetical protein
MVTRVAPLHPQLEALAGVDAAADAQALAADALRRGFA